MIKLNISSGSLYLLQGMRELFRPGKRRYAVLPILMNMFILFFIVSSLGAYLWELFAGLNMPIPEWLQLLIGGIILVIYLLGSIFISMTCFSVLCHLIGSPFYGFLSEKTINDKLGVIQPPISIIKLIMRTMRRELKKLFYGLPRFALGLIIFIFPLTTPIFPLYWFYIMSWYAGMTYIDYAADNQGIPFNELLATIRRNRLTVLSFGVTLSIGLLIPIVNLFIPPAGVIGASLLWLDLNKSGT